MTQPDETWADRMQGLTGASEKEGAELVRDIYKTAQDDLDAQRAQAELEREE
ncbi:hypothetical protein PUR28_00340 [Streptomyces sp. BE308]|uniref:hypothetical protein n=1 Tax=unclassified Streptomyces TaxID=2593676 RepID=UPI000A61453C|nr:MULTISPECIES: hypothetical protein [unclassified Streptomyces]MEE1789253.1 hypothetical protein [Streptomyces sp. BE308]